MRKSLFVFVVLTVLASAIPASAQSSLWRYFGVCPPGDELCRVMIGNQQMVREMRTGYMGYYRGDGFYATHDPSGRPLPRLVKIAVGAGIGASIGGGVGDFFGHGREGTLIGAGIGALIGARHGSSKNNQRDGVIVTPPQGQQGVRIASDGTPVAFGTRLPGYQAQPEPEWQMLRNEFEGVTIYARVQGLDPNQPIVIPAGQTVTVQIPRGSQIWAEAQVCVNEGCTVQRWRQDVGRRPLPQGAGWVFYNPEEGR